MHNGPNRGTKRQRDMGRTGTGVEIRAKSIRLSFALEGAPQKHTLMLNGAPMLPTPPNIKYATRLASEIRERIKHGTFSLAEYFPASGTGAAPLTVGSQLDAWLDTQRIEASTRAGYESAIKFWKGHLGDKALRALKRSEILSAVASRPDLSGKTLNNYADVLHAALDLAVLDGCLTTSPAKDMPRAKYTKPTPDPFTLDERDLIIAHMRKTYPEPVANMVEFWFFTGLRTSELAGLRWGSIDLRKGTALVHEATVRGVEKTTTKTGVERTVRLDNAMPALLRQKAHTFLAGDHVFLDARYGTPWTDERAFRRSYWTPALKKLGIRYRRPYNCRHTRATEMLMADMNHSFCAGQLGHSVQIFQDVYSKWLPGAADDIEMAKLQPKAERTGA